MSFPHLDCVTFAQYSLKILQAVSNWLTTIFRSCHRFSSRFKSKLTLPLRNIHHLLGNQLQCRFGLVFVLLKGDLISQSLVENMQNPRGEPSSACGLFHLFFILKKSPVLNDYKHPDKVIQPPLCFSYGEW